MDVRFCLLPGRASSRTLSNPWPAGILFYCFIVLFLLLICFYWGISNLRTYVHSKRGLETRPTWPKILCRVSDDKAVFEFLKMSHLNADICCVWHCLFTFTLICLKVSVCIFQFRRRLALFSEVRLSSGCVLPLFSPTEHVGWRSPRHPGSPRTDHCD